MKSYGAHAERHEGSRKSASHLIRLLLDTPPARLAVVHELIDKRLIWEDTAVGRSAGKALIQMRTLMKEEIDELKEYIRTLEKQFADGTANTYLVQQKLLEATKKRDELLARSAENEQRRQRQGDKFDGDSDAPVGVVAMTQRTWLDYLSAVLLAGPGWLQLLFCFLR